jgi:hypothetical protein
LVKHGQRCSLRTATIWEQQAPSARFYRNRMEYLKRLSPTTQQVNQHSSLIKTAGHSKQRVNRQSRSINEASPTAPSLAIGWLTKEVRLFNHVPNFVPRST